MRGARMLWVNSEWDEWCGGGDECGGGDGGDEVFFPNDNPQRHVAGETINNFDFVNDNPQRQSPETCHWGNVSIVSKLKSIGGTDSDVLENMKPAVRKRVEVLRDIQAMKSKLSAKHQLAVKGLSECKASESNIRRIQVRDIVKEVEDHLKTYSSAVMDISSYEVGKGSEQLAELFTKVSSISSLDKFACKLDLLIKFTCSRRYDIVTGAVEVDGAKEEDAMDQMIQEKGVHEFWLTVLKNNKIMAEVITERDEAALKYLKDIKWCRMDDPKGFKLEFFFDTHPFFTNSVLTKVYHMIDDDEPILEKAIGTTIEWLPGKCLTQKILKKKPKKGSKNAKPITKTED
ncbi:nucleosome assembly protein 1,4 [Tanacetum coccineum]